jgi:hypothetical protein
MTDKKEIEKAFKYPVGGADTPFQLKGELRHGKEVNGFEGFCAFTSFHAE